MTRRIDLNLATAVVGLGVLAFLLHRLGVDEVFHQLAHVGWGWFFIIGQEVGAILANTAGWHYAFAASHRTVSFWELFRMRQAGDGFDYLIPAALMGGDLLRINLLRQRLSLSLGAASVTIAKFTQTLGQVLFIALGLALAAPFAPLRPDLLPWLWGFILGWLALMGAILFALWRGVFSRITRFLLLWLPLRLARYLPVDKISELDDYITSFLRGNQKEFWYSTGLFGVGWALGILEVYLIFYFMGLPIDLATAVTVETLSIFVDALMFFVPGKLGTQEGGKVLIFMSLGLPPVSGLAFGLIRRIREIFWAGVGMVFLTTFRTMEAAKIEPEP